MGIGDRLKEERTRLGLNQTEFASIAGVQKNAQSKYENGERSPDSAYLAAIAAAGVDVLYIITGNRMPTPSGLAPRSAALVDNFENMADEDKRAIERLAAAVQKPDTKTGTN